MYSIRGGDFINDTIIETLLSVIRALDAIAVTGQQNRGNLYGSIETLKEVVRQLYVEQKSDAVSSRDIIDE